jgi:hypothetical protein
MAGQFQAATVAASSGPGLGANGQHRKAYYIVGHNPNTLDEVIADLNAGANALEPDIMRFDDSATVIGTTDRINSHQGPSGLFVYHDHVTVTTRLPTTVEAYLDGVHDMVQSQHRNVALITLDIKSAAANAALVSGLQTAVRTHLNYNGVMVYVIFSVGSFGDAPGLDTIATQLNDHEGLMIDAENDPAAVLNLLKGKGARNVAYGNGSAGECSGLAPNVLVSMDQASWIRAGQSANFAIPYAFPICNTQRMFEYMKTTDGLIPDIDNLIGGGTAEIGPLSALVAAHPDVYLATSADNPFLQGKEAYGLRVSTFDKAGAGTDSLLTFTLTGTCGSASVSLDASYQKRFEAGDVNYVTIPSKNLGHLTSLTLSSDGANPGAAWDPQTVWFSSDLYGIPNESISVNLNYDDHSIDSSHPRTVNLTSYNTVGKCDTVTTITGHSANPSVAGEQITVSFTVTGPSGPTGQVIVTDDQSNTICTASVSQGSCSGRIPAAGSRVLKAAYQGDANAYPSSATANHTVNKASTTTSISSTPPNSAVTPNPSVTGQEVRIGYSVAVTAPGALVAPTSMSQDAVIVTDDQSNQICTGTVAAGFCMGRIPAAGARTLTAAFSGDANFNSSKGTAGQTVNKANTTTTITGHSPNPSSAGEPVAVSFTVAVVAPGMVVAPTSIGAGTVTVRDDQNNVICIATVLAGTCTGPIATAGPRTLTATYAGDGNFLQSLSPSVSQMMEATQADECKKDGWAALYRRNATKFVNQGDCIQYVNTHK